MTPPSPSPEVYEFLEAEGFKLRIRLPANKVLHDRHRAPAQAPVGRPPKEVRRYYANFSYQAVLDGAPPGRRQGGSGTQGNCIPRRP